MARFHLGECEITDRAVRGRTMHIGAQGAAMAEGGEILVSIIVKNTVV